MGVSKIKAFREKTAGFFWNWEDYPITSSSANPDLESKISYNIRLALFDMGYGLVREVGIYGDDIKPHPPVPHIPYLPFLGSFEVGENAADWNMAEDIAREAQWELDILVLAKKKPGSEVFRVLQILKAWEYNVFLLEPPPDTTAEDLFSSVDSILACTKRL